MPRSNLPPSSTHCWAEPDGSDPLRLELRQRLRPPTRGATSAPTRCRRGVLPGLRRRWNARASRPCRSCTDFTEQHRETGAVATRSEHGAERRADHRVARSAMATATLRYCGHRRRRGVRDDPRPHRPGQWLSRRGSANGRFAGRRHLPHQGGRSRPIPGFGDVPGQQKHRPYSRVPGVESAIPLVFARRYCRTAARRRT